jgi:hypothetical protein
MSAKTYVKQLVLRLIDRQGYVLLKKADFDRLRADAWLADTGGVWAIEKARTELNREVRLAQERSAQELERARAENWEMRKRVEELEQTNRERNSIDEKIEHPHKM